MDVELLASLLVLALIDSTSVGTLVMPLWLMLAPHRFHPRRVVLFLVTVGGFYLVLGVALAAGATVAIERFGDALDSPPARVGQYTVGFALLGIGIVMEPWTKAGKQRRARRRAERARATGPGRVSRWRERALDGSAPLAALLTLALAAAAIETATMVPYLAAIGLLASSELSFGVVGVTLAVYCVVMITPALVLLAARVLLDHRITPALARIEAFMTRHAREASAWVVSLAGLFLIATVPNGLTGT